MLLEIKQYLIVKKSANLQELAQHFNQDLLWMRHMLNHWVNKGMAHRYKLTPSCGTRCQACPSAQTEIYQWIDEPLELKS